MKSFIGCPVGVAPCLELVSYGFYITISRNYGKIYKKWTRSHLEDFEVIILSTI